MNTFTIFFFVLSVYASDCVLQPSHSKVGDNHRITDDCSTKLEENDMSMSQCGTKDEHISQSNACFKEDIQHLYDKPPPKPCDELNFPYGFKKDGIEFEKRVKSDLEDTGYMDNYDLRIKNRTCPSITEISDQASCSSCWAIAATDVMTDRLCLHSNGTNTNRFSALGLMSCCKYCLTDKKRPCRGGGKQVMAWYYWTKRGIVSGHRDKKGKMKGCRNYHDHVQPCTHDLSKARTEKTSKCTVSTMDCPSVEEEDWPTCMRIKKECNESLNTLTHNEGKMKGRNCYVMRRQFDEREAAIKLEILINGPVHAVMSMYPDFYTMFTPNYDNFHKVEPYLHKYNDQEKGCDAHSIRIVGWGKKGNKSYWIVANSYGEKWGDRGFFHLDFNHDSDLKKGKDEVFAGIPNLI